MRRSDSIPRAGAGVNGRRFPIGSGNFPSGRSAARACGPVDSVAALADGPITPNTPSIRPTRVLRLRNSALNSRTAALVSRSPASRLSMRAFSCSNP